MAKRYNLAWQTFMSHGKDLFKDLYETNRFSDVTLVSDDQYQYKAHRFVYRVLQAQSASSGWKVTKSKT